jgi:hypothetical protein
MALLVGQNLRITAIIVIDHSSNIILKQAESSGSKRPAEQRWEGGDKRHRWQDKGWQDKGWQDKGWRQGGWQDKGWHVKSEDKGWHVKSEDKGWHVKSEDKGWHACVKTEVGKAPWAAIKSHLELIYVMFFFWGWQSKAMLFLTLGNYGWPYQFYYLLGGPTSAPKAT